MATPGYAKGVEIHKCHICKEPTTFVCTDCNKPVCHKHVQIAQLRDKKFRCLKDYMKYVEKYGDGIK